MQSEKTQTILSKITNVLYTMALVILLSAIVGLILAFPVQWLWNFIFKNFPQMKINVFQAWALNVLASILFGHKGTNGKK